MEDRLYKKLEAYGKSDFYPFHMPGHKRNPLAVEGDFPGRAFKVEQVLGFGKDDVKQLRKVAPKANLTVRNFPATVDALRKKLKIKEGGDKFIFATTTADNQHVMVVCRKK